MLFYPESSPIPAGFERGGFRVRMLKPIDAELDYYAVTESRHLLLARSGGKWPEEHFTIEDNLKDLIDHEQDHLSRKNFAFTIINTKEDRCLGCIYIRPLSLIMKYFDISRYDTSRLKENDAVVDYWVIPDIVIRKRDIYLVGLLRKWLVEEWSFSRLFFMANGQESRSIHVYTKLQLELYYAVYFRRPPSSLHFFSIDFESEWPRSSCHHSFC